MTRTKWTDVSPDWVDYQEARVQALYEENLRLKVENDMLRRIFAEENGYEPLPSVLVC
jgi:regulator of replication initiation timing